MFKLQINWLKTGEWVDCVYPPSPYDVSMSRFHYYTNLWGHEHEYRIIPTLTHLIPEDTPLAESYGG